MFTVGLPLKCANGVSSSLQRTTSHRCTRGQSTRPFSMMGIRSLLMYWMMERCLEPSTRGIRSPRCAGAPAR